MMITLNDFAKIGYSYLARKNVTENGTTTQWSQTIPCNCLWVADDAVLHISVLIIFKSLFLIFYHKKKNHFERLRSFQLKNNYRSRSLTFFFFFVGLKFILWVWWVYFADLVITSDLRADLKTLKFVNSWTGIWMRKLVLNQSNSVQFSLFFFFCEQVNRILKRNLNILLLKWIDLNIKL